MALCNVEMHYGHLEALPYVQRAACNLLAVARRLSACVNTCKGDAAVMELLRELALSVAAVDRLLTTFICQTLVAAGVASASPFLPLDHLLEELHHLPPARVSKLMPPGGTVSLLYHVDSQLLEIERCLRQLPASAGSWASETTGTVASGSTGVVPGQAGDGARRRGAAGRVLSWARSSVLWRATSWAASLLLWVLTCGMLRPVGRYGRLERMRRAADQMSILVRLWTVANSTLGNAPPGIAGGEASLRKEVSYMSLVAQLSEHDFILTKKPIARKLLEKTTLPRGAAIWSTRSPRNALLKRILDTMYATLASTFHWIDPPRGRPGVLAWLAFAVSSALHGLFFLALPLEAEETTAGALFRPNIRMITMAWRATDTPLFHRIATWLVRRQVPVSEAVEVGGLGCHVLCNHTTPQLAAHLAALGSGAVGTGECDPTPMQPVAGALAGSAAAGAAAIATVNCGLAWRPCALAVRAAAGAAAIATVSRGLARRHGRYATPADVFAAPATSRPPGSGGDSEEEQEEEAGRQAAALQRIAATAASAAAAPRMLHGEAVATPGPRVPRPLFARLPKTLMHIHGGGFVGRSFLSDVRMLGGWVKAAPEPFLAVYPRYSLSPEAKFPTALLELARVYAYLQQHCEAVAVSGESAGGNLAAALVLYCVWHDIPVPAGLVLCYPALCLNPSPSPSRALHISDAVVPANLLMSVAEHYTGDSILPTEADDEMLFVQHSVVEAGSSSSSSGGGPGHRGSGAHAGHHHRHHSPSQRHQQRQAPHSARRGGLAGDAAPSMRAAGSEPATPTGANPAPHESSLAAAGAGGHGSLHLAYGERSCSRPGTLCDCVTAPVRTNALAHPAYASDADLRRFPPTHILGGGLDPLLDDGVDFNATAARGRARAAARAPLPRARLDLLCGSAAGGAGGVRWDAGLLLRRAGHRASSGGGRDREACGRPGGRVVGL
jgi:acetyl esterase/lipase